MIVKFFPDYIKTRTPQPGYTCEAHNPVKTRPVVLKTLEDMQFHFLHKMAKKYVYGPQLVSPS